MIEANPVKFYLAKYFFLLIAIVQWAISCALFFYYGLTLANIIVVTLLAFLGFVLVFVFLTVSERIKRVRLADNKFVVMEDNANLRFGWDEVKSFRLIPFFNLCKVKIRGRKGSFYFFSTASLGKQIGSFVKSSTHMRNKLI